MRDCFFHDWEKWEQYKQLFTIIPGRLSPKEIQGKAFQEEQDWQKRKCKRCGKEQREKVCN